MSKSLVRAWSRPALLLAVLLGVAPGVAAAARGPVLAVPPTPAGAAPLIHRGSSHPDSLETALALAGNQAHRPVAVALATRGLELALGGNAAAAIDAWDCAARLDPSFAPAHLAAMRFAPLAAGRRGLQGLIGLPGSLVSGFTAQQTGLANLLLLVCFPLLFAVAVCGLLVALRHAPSVHHLFWEHLQPALPRFVAKWAVWGLMALPLIWNLGLLLWVALLLAAAVPLLTRAQRRFAVAMAMLVAAAPLGVDLVATVVTASDPARVEPAIWRGQQAGRSPETLQEVQRLAERQPSLAAVHFTESLLARQLGRLPEAGASLERAEACNQIPGSRFDAAWAILAYREGRVEEAIRRLSAAAETDPDRFELRYNLSKAYARSSLFLKADREMRHAFELDAGRVRREERRRLELRVEDLIEERLASTDLWALLLSRRDGSGFQLPPAAAALFPGGNPRLLWPGLLLLPLVAVPALRASRRLVIHTCSQCGRRVCRRCLKRRDRRVFCTECALTAGRWGQAQVTQVLLTRLLGRHDRLRDRLVDVARLVVPGLGAALRGRIDRAFLQLICWMAALVWLAGGGFPIPALPECLIQERLLPPQVVGIAALAALQVGCIRGELRGMRRRSTLKEFLGRGRPAAGARKAA